MKNLLKFTLIITVIVLAYIEIKFNFYCFIYYVLRYFHRWSDLPDTLRGANKSISMPKVTNKIDGNEDGRFCVSWVEGVLSRDHGGTSWDDDDWVGGVGVTGYKRRCRWTFHPLMVIQWGGIRVSRRTSKSKERRMRWRLGWWNWAWRMERLIGSEVQC
jgi:hypothetical protein